MRILVFHGYLLRGTGSNIYNASLAHAFTELGHEVHLLCQDRHAAELPFVDAVGRWEGGKLVVERVREPVRCTAYLPDIGRVLPVYVADAYEGFDAKSFLDLSDAELDHYLSANAAAVAEVAELVRPDVGLANHALMGPAIFRRGLRGSVPYAVKIHGSALEYTVRPDPERFLPFAREGIEGAAGILVGSHHMAERLWALLPETRERTRLGPPGVDVHHFRPAPAADLQAHLTALADRLEGAAAAGCGGEAGAADAIRALDPARDSIVSYVGKLIVSKGVDLLLAAWPLVVAELPHARLCVVGFGTYREGVESLIEALGRGDLAAAREIAARGRELEGGPPGELRHLAAFLDGLEGERRERYLTAAPEAAARVHFTGRLEHSDLPDLLVACQAQVVPSTFPEAFGMVAAEAAACGVLPLSAAHSGLAEVTAALAPALDPPLRPLLAFEVGPGAVEEIADKLIRWLGLSPAERHRAGAALAAVSAERFGWEHVAERVIAAAQGRLDDVPEATLGRGGLASAERVVFRPLALSRDRIRALALPAALVAGLVGVGCGTTRGAHPNLVNGKTLFVQKCGACHTLAHANTKGIQGPNLDAAFVSARQQGFEKSGIEGVVHDQISHVLRGSIMPKNLVTGENATDVAAYVAFVAGAPGKDSGALAAAGLPKTSNRTAVEQNGQLNIPADPSGALAFTYGKATATAGSVTLVMPNKSSISHDISVKGNGVNENGPVVGQGGTSKVTANLQPGTYEFYCSVPGHEAGGMKGTLTVK